MQARAVCVVLLAVFVLGVPLAAHAQWTWTPQTGRWINIKRMPRETAELQVEYARSQMLKGDYKKALNETNKFRDFYGDTDMADDNQFLRGEIHVAQGNYVRAAKEFQKVVTGFPDSDLFDEVIAKQYEIGDMLYEQGQAKLKKRWRLFRKRPLKRAIAVYSTVIDNQPFTDAASEAQYKVGLCHHTRGEYVDAAFEYLRVIEDYGASDWVDDACHSLARCYYDGSLPVDYDQLPCQLAINAIDEFRGRYPDDERVAELQGIRAEMRNTIAGQRFKTAHFYEKRRDFDSARIYYELVVDEFSDTPTAQKAAQWLAENPVTEARAAHRVLKAQRGAL